MIINDFAKLFQFVVFLLLQLDLVVQWPSNDILYGPWHHELCIPKLLYQKVFDFVVVDIVASSQVSWTLWFSN